MDEDSSPSAGSKPNWLERLSQFLLREPENLEELTGMLHSAFERHLLDADALSITAPINPTNNTKTRLIKAVISPLFIFSVTP